MQVCEVSSTDNSEYTGTGARRTGVERDRERPGLSSLQLDESEAAPTIDRGKSYVTNALRCDA